MEAEDGNRVKGTQSSSCLSKSLKRNNEALLKVVTPEMDSQSCCCSRQRTDSSVTKPRCRMKQANGCDDDEGFDRAVVFCDCGRKALRLMSNTEKNPGRKFFRCPLYKIVETTNFVEMHLAFFLLVFVEMTNFMRTEVLKDRNLHILCNSVSSMSVKRQPVEGKKSKKKSKAASTDVQDMVVEKPTEVTNGDASKDHKSEKKKKKEKRKLDQDMDIDNGDAANGVGVEQNDEVKKQKKKKEEEEEDEEDKRNDEEVLLAANESKKKKKKKSKSEDAE